MTVWSGRRRYLLDLVVLLWIALWIAIAVSVSRAVSQISAIATPINDVGSTMSESARALAGLDRLPLVGSSLSGLSVSAHHAATDAYTTAANLRGEIIGISVLIGVFLAAVPIVTILAVYLPRRVGQAMEMAYVRRALRAGDPVVDELLAMRALQTLPLRRLSQVSRTPLRDATSGSYRALADAELKRLGVRRPR